MEQWVTIIILGVIATAIVMVPIVLNIFNKPDDTPEIASYLDMPPEDAWIPTQPPQPIDTPQFNGQPSGLSDYSNISPQKRHAPEQMLGAPVQLKVAPQPMHGGKTSKIRESLDPDNDQTAAAKKEQWLSRIRQLDQDVVMFEDGTNTDNFDPAVLRAKAGAKKGTNPDEEPSLFSLNGNSGRAEDAAKRKSIGEMWNHRAIDILTTLKPKVKSSSAETADEPLKPAAVGDDALPPFLKLPSAFANKKQPSEPTVEPKLVSHRPLGGGGGLFSTQEEGEEKPALPNETKPFFGDKKL